MSDISGYAHSLDNDFDPDDWRAEQHADECKLQADLLNVLDAALKRPLTRDEAMLLAWGSGVANDFYREHQ